MLHFQRWKVILILGIVIAGFLFALPNVFSAATVARLPTWLPHKQVNLGLDLQGGAHLLYQLDEKEMRATLQVEAEIDLLVRQPGGRSRHGRGENTLGSAKWNPAMGMPRIRITFPSLKNAAFPLSKLRIEISWCAWIMRKPS